MPNTPIDTVPSFVAAISRGRRWVIAIGVMMIIAGIAAIAFPLAGGLTITLITGCTLMLGGIATAAGGFSLPNWQGKIPVLLIGVLWLGAGLYLLMRPMEGLFALTIVVAVVFVIEGILKVGSAFLLRPFFGWGWVLFDGIIALVLGVMLMAQFPSSALWALGVLVGINILISGWSLVMLATSAGRYFDENLD